MKMLITLLMIFSFQNVLAREYISKVKKYLYKDTERIIELSGWNLSDDGKTNKYINANGKEIEVRMEDCIPEVFEDIAGVKSGELVIAKTLVGNSNTETIDRVCKVLNVFENKKALIECRTYKADEIPGYGRPDSFFYWIKNVESLVASTEEVEGFKKGDIALLTGSTDSISAGTNVKVLDVMANGEIIIEKKMEYYLGGTKVGIKRDGVEKVSLDFLKKIEL